MMFPNQRNATANSRVSMDLRNALHEQFTFCKKYATKFLPTYNQQAIHTLIYHFWNSITVKRILFSRCHFRSEIQLISTINCNKPCDSISLSLEHGNVVSALVPHTITIVEKTAHLPSKFHSWSIFGAGDTHSTDLAEKNWTIMSGQNNNFLFLFLFQRPSRDFYMLERFANDRASEGGITWILTAFSQEDIHYKPGPKVLVTANHESDLQLWIWQIESPSATRHLYKNLPLDYALPDPLHWDLRFLRVPLFHVYRWVQAIPEEYLQYYTHTTIRLLRQVPEITVPLGFISQRDSAAFRIAPRVMEAFRKQTARRCWKLMRRLYYSHRNQYQHLLETQRDKII